jgi:hypothetical protein
MIQIGRAFADRLVNLGGDETRLALHDRRVVLPGFEEGMLVRFVERDHVHQRDGTGLNPELAFDGVRVLPVRSNHVDKVPRCHPRESGASTRLARDYVIPAFAGDDAETGAGRT